MAKQSMFDDPQSRAFAIRILNEEDATRGNVAVSRNIVGVLDKDFIIQAVVAVDFLPSQGKEGVFYLLPDDTLWLYSGGLYICVSADVDKDYVDAKFNAAVATSKNYTDGKLDHTVLTGVEVSQNTSTVTVTETKKNLKTGNKSSQDTALPVANATQAGVMSSATYQSILDTQAVANNLLDGGVVVNSLPSSPSQADLTSAWLTATGKTSLINRAYIWSPDNSEGYTYFSNVGLWYVTSSGGGSSISVAPFTNSQAGIIKGAIADGQVFAEADGTGSIYGWDALKTRTTNVEATLGNKVDKVAGKGLSTEDYTTNEKQKLASVETGATKTILDETLDSSSDNGVKNKAVAGAINELNTIVGTKADQSDLTALSNRVATAEGEIDVLQSDVSSLESNKVDKVAGKGLSTEDYTTAEKEKLAGIFAGAEPNVQADWNVVNQNADAYIKNKPTNVSAFVNDAGYLTDVPTEYITENELTSYNYQTATDIQNAIAGKANTTDLAEVATSGDYGDLANTPTIPKLYGTTGQNTDGAMSQKATSDALTNLQTNLEGQIGEVRTDLEGKADTEDLAVVATTGSYTDLLNRPESYTLPTASSAQLGGVKVGAGLAIDEKGVLSATGGGTADSVAWGHIIGTLSNQTDLQNALDAKTDEADLATVATSGLYNDLIGTPNLATVATSGSYTDLDNAPNLAAVATSGSYNDLSNKPAIPTVPTDVSAFNNDAGYLVENDVTTLRTAVSGHTTSIDNLQSGKVDKIEGKSLSTNDYTTSDKNKLAGIAAGAEVNVQPDWNQTNTSADNYIKNKPSIPTKVSDLNNDSGFVTKSVDNLTNYYKKTEIYTKAEVGNLIAGIPGWTIEVVQNLPQTGQERIIYLVPSVSADDSYDEYIWVPSLNNFDKIGDTKVDLTNYYTKGEIDSQMNSKQGLLSQGTGIVISGSQEISVDTNAIATKTSVDTLAGKVITAEGDIDDLQTDLGSAQSSIGQLQTDLGVAEGKLATIENGAEKNVQADWNQTSNSADDYIKNKPSVPVVSYTASTETLNIL